MEGARFHINIGSRICVCVFSQDENQAWWLPERLVHSAEEQKTWGQLSWQPPSRRNRIRRAPGGTSNPAFPAPTKGRAWFGLAAANILACRVPFCCQRLWTKKPCWDEADYNVCSWLCFEPVCSRPKIQTEHLSVLSSWETGLILNKILSLRTKT